MERFIEDVEYVAAFTIEKHATNNITYKESTWFAAITYHATEKFEIVARHEAFWAHPGKFDLVITDMTMPKMTGDELAKEIMAIRPDIPIILCTGFSERITEERAKEMGIKAFVMKPFAIRDFASTIRKVLDQEKEK